MGKRVSKFGSYSNDGLSTGLNLEFLESDLIEMREVITQDFKNIELDLEKQLLRLDNYLKKHFGALFRREDFVKWFFDKKKITQWGSNLPKISDEELFEYSKIYIEELNALKNQKIDTRYKEKIWLHDEATLSLLANMLETKKYLENAAAFTELFLNGKRVSINWIMYKTTLIHLITKLKLNKFLSQQVSENNFINRNFLLKGKPIKNISQSKEQMPSKPRRCEEIDFFINEYKKTLPKNE